MTNSILRLSLLQTALAWESAPDNMDRMASLLPGPGSSDLIILPEMWATGFSMQPAQVAESVNGPAWQWMRDHASATGATICGSLAVADGGRFYNRFYAVHPDGTSVQYDKKHLFTYSGEHLPYSPGTKRIHFSVNGWRIMPVICYDLRFPAWCRNTEDYDLLLIVANWPEARIHHWDALTRARSVENQSYVAAVNRTGTDGNGLTYPGHSVVYDMNGEIVCFADQAEGRFDIAIDGPKLEAFRQRFPFLADRDSLFEIPGVDLH